MPLSLAAMEPKPHRHWPPQLVACLGESRKGDQRRSCVGLRRPGTLRAGN